MSNHTNINDLGIVSLTETGSTRGNMAKAFNEGLENAKVSARQWRLIYQGNSSDTTYRGGKVKYEPKNALYLGSVKGSFGSSMIHYWITRGIDDGKLMVQETYGSSDTSTCALPLCYLGALDSEAREFAEQVLPA